MTADRNTLKREVEKSRVRERQVGEIRRETCRRERERVGLV